MSPEIRPACAADLIQVAALDRAAQGADRPPAYWSDELARPQARLSVIVESAQVVGFTATWWVADEVELHDIVVDPTCRGRGLGRRLLQALRASAGPASIFLEVRADNEPARALYRRVGFVEVGRRRRYYADATDAILYVWSGDGDLG